MSEIKNPQETLGPPPFFLKNPQARAYIIFGSLFSILLVADLLTKHFAALNLNLGQVVRFIPRVISITYWRNDGMAFGWFSGGTTWLIVISSIMIIAAAVFYVMYTRKEQRPLLVHIAFGFFFAGAIGNLVDRVFLGYVRDFIMFDFWPNHPIFNLADAWINLAVVMIVVYFIIDEVKNHRRKRRAKAGQLPQEGDGGGLDTQSDNERD
ncbi:MAG: signal peptidase II [Firmicutes bacterium]|nr:signal peptidase II [Bacillota bacterium]